MAFSQFSRKTLAVSLLLVLFLAAEAALFLFNPFPSAVVRGVDVQEFAFNLAVKLFAVLFLGSAICLLFHKKINSLLSRLELKHILILIAVYTITFSAMSLLDYYSFQVPPPDLQIFNQIFWNSLNGNLFEMSRFPYQYFAEHMSPILFLLVPIYALFPAPEFFLILTSVVLPLGAIPVYLIAREKLNNAAASVFSVAYLIYPAMNYLNVHEFHPLYLAVPMVLFAFYFLMRRKHALFILFFVLLLATKETVALDMIMLGIFIAVFMRKRLLGLAVSAVSAAWFYVSLYVLIPAVRYAAIGQATYLPYLADLYGAFGSTMSEIAFTILTNPLLVATTILKLQKVGYLVLLALPVAFLSLLSPAILLITIPAFLQILLSSNQIYATIYFSYNAHVLPFIFLAAIYGLSQTPRYLEVVLEKVRLPLKSFASIALAGVFVFSLFSAVMFGPSPLSLADPLPMRTSFAFEKYAISQHHGVVWEAISKIPENASLEADYSLITQLSSRRNAHYLEGDSASDDIVFDLDYVVLDTANPANQSSKFSREELAGLAQGYDRVFDRDGVLVFRKR